MVEGDLSPLKAATVLRRFGIRPRKSLGQNFLVSEGVRQQILEAADLQPGEWVLEIGPGLGALTERLAESAAGVVAVEFDSRLMPILAEILAGRMNVKLIEGDILEIDLSTILQAPGYVVVANIPYNITSALIRKLMEAKQAASRIVLTIQREVAERIVAPAGKMSLLALSVQLYGEPRLAGVIPGGAFYPPPGVDSAILRVDIRPMDPQLREHLPALFALARAGFGQRRKMLRNALASAVGLNAEQARALCESAGVDGTRRAQELTVEDWLKLAESWRAEEVV
ncbi:MAG TPA: ribosomal RNA small subunit methyltransferase A [Chloroflexi bacterium]|nr:ribosomal RNA small subunit methyltransferase A [Chloroflexota bacterium]